jgi:hypothetical protein
MEDRTDCLPDIEQNVNKAKRCSIAAIVFSILNLLAILGMVVLNLGLTFIGL